MDKGKPIKRSLSQQKEQSILLGVILGLFGLATGLFAAISANSTAILSEVLKNVGLTIAVILSWLSLRKVRVGKSEAYNYGIGKLENFSGLIVAVVMIVSFFLIIFHTVERFQARVEMHPIGVDIGLVFSIVALTCSIALWNHDHHLAKKEHSPVMESLWRLYRLKTVSTGVVILSLLFSIIFNKYSWSLYIDPAGSIIVSLFLAFSIYSVSSQSMYDLLDRSLEESLQLVILRALASHFHEYEALHGIRSRRTGGNTYIEIFLEFEDERKMSEVQQVINSIKTDLEQKIQGSHVVIAPTRTAVT
jgi:ferrous-iron efflux pump FieF